MIQTQIISYKKQLATEKAALSLTNILMSDRCQNIISMCRVYRDRNPFKTLTTFIKQVITPDKSCKNVVAGVVAEHLYFGKRRLSANTGPYCKARGRLPEAMIKALVTEVAEKAMESAPKQWRWRNHNVHVVDGTTVILPDTDSKRKNHMIKHLERKGACRTHSVLWFIKKFCLS